VPSSLSAPPGEQQGALPLRFDVNVAFTTADTYPISVVRQTDGPVA
jgi:hypothetical protein